MPRRCQQNLDTRNGNLLDQRRDANMARGKAEMEARVKQRIVGLVRGIEETDYGPAAYARLQRAVTEEPKAATKKRGRRLWTPGQRTEPRAKMKAYCAKMKAAKPKNAG